MKGVTIKSTRNKRNMELTNAEHADPVAAGYDDR